MENEETIVDLPPPPSENKGYAGEHGKHEDRDGCHGDTGHHCCGRSGGHETRKDSKFIPGCITGCLLAVLSPFLFFALIAVCSYSTIKDAFESEGIKSGKTFKELFKDNSECDWAGVDDFPTFDEVWSCGDDDEDSAKVVRIAINGTITLDQGRWNKNPGSALMALQAIKRATLDEDVRGIILEIDSPGGGITASDIIWKSLNDFKAAGTNRAVVVMMGDLCASGGYYVSAAADRIVAHPTTLTGSIGVIISSMNVKELASKIGIKDVSIASGENKQMLNPLHDLTPEQYRMLKDSVDALHRRFVSIVADGRGLTQAKVMEIADGRVILAPDAEKYGLIDKIGYFPDAMQSMKKLLGNDSLHVVKYIHKASFMELLQDEGIFGMSSGIRRLEEASRTRLLYKW